MSKKKGDLPEQYEHPNIAGRDWRLQAITALSKPYNSGRMVHPVGTPVESAGPVRLHGEKLFILPPNGAAIFLSHAWRARAEAVRLLEGLQPAAFDLDLDAARKVSEGTEGAVFDMVEHLVAVVVFAYSSLEAFANEMIPQEFVFRREPGHGRCVEEYGKEQIERHVSLDLKLDAVLPEVLETSSPKGTKVWQRYVALKRLRDRIIHMKSADRYPEGGSDAEEWVWRTLLEPWVLDTPAVARTLVGSYFDEGRKPPRWLYRCPVPLLR